MGNGDGTPGEEVRRREFVAALVEVGVNGEAGEIGDVVAEEGDDGDDEGHGPLGGRLTFVDDAAAE